MAAAPVLSLGQAGLYCAAGDFHIDPWRPTPRALITHAHSDHARPGQGVYLATPVTAALLRHRLGPVQVETIGLGEPRRIGGANVSFHPAGHVPGSAQIRVEVGGEVWVVSGDYKLDPDGISTPFEPVQAHGFISECTFGLPIFRWQPPARIRDDINAWWAAAAAAGQTAVIGAYSLGKAQRILAGLDPAIGPILCHGAVEATNAVLRAEGVALPATLPLSAATGPRSHPGALVVVPPAVLGEDWSRRFGPVTDAFASGWMALRGVRRWRSLDRGFVLSDHADWDGLNTAIRATGAERVLVTHGYTDVFARWLSSQGLDAAVLKTEFAGDGSADDDRLPPSGTAAPGPAVA